MGVARATLNPPKSLFILYVLIIGITGMLSQIVLLRELLVSFMGNELSIGVILGNWLLLEAAGSYFLGKRIEHRRWKIEFFITVNVILILVLPISLYAARVVKALFGFYPGEGLGIVHMCLFSFLILLPVSLTHGALFTFSCKIYSGISHSRDTSVGVVYIFEVLGTALGGIVYTYLLLPLFNAFQIILGLVLINLIVSVLFLYHRLSRGAVSRILGLVILIYLGCAVYIVSSGTATEWHRQSVEQAWHNQSIVYYGNSPYGNIVVTQREEQYNLFSDGIPTVTIPTPDIEFAESFVHFPLLFHSNPEEVLVVSGGAGGVIAEIGKHPVQRIGYAEIDPLVIGTLNTISPPSVKAEWQDPRVTIYADDGRNQLRATKREYDVILVGLTNPSDLQINRLFTLEFFYLAKKRMKEGGIILFSLPGSLTYLNQELKQLNACIWFTLNEAYRYVRVIPGDLNLYLASDSPAVARLNPDDLARRLDERKINTRLFTPYYIRYRLQESRRQWFMSSVSDTEVELNRDHKPVGVYYSLSLWNAKFSPFFERFFQHVGRLRLLPLVLPCGFLFIFFLLMQRISPKAVRDAAVPLAVVTSGFCGMLFDLIVVFGYQIVYGCLYHIVGLLITAFMIGAGLGGVLSTFILAKMKRINTAFMLLEAGIILLTIILPVFFLYLLPIWQAHAAPTTAPAMAPAAFEFLFYILGIAGGFLVGAEFPVAVKIHTQTARVFSHSIGLLNASDLVGGWMGGLVGGIVLIPILGLRNTCLFLTAIKVTALAVFILSRRSLRRSAFGIP